MARRLAACGTRLVNSTQENKGLTHVVMWWLAGSRLAAYGLLILRRRERGQLMWWLTGSRLAARGLPSLPHRVLLKWRQVFRYDCTACKISPLVAGETCDWGLFTPPSCTFLGPLCTLSLV